MPEKQSQSSNRIRETLGRLYEHQPPHFREYMRRYQEEPTSRVFAPLAEAYRRLGRLDEAIDICIEGLKHHPDFPGGRVALARCFFDKKKYAKAKDELEIVVGISPDNILAQRLLGDCFFSLKEMEQALRCYKLASVLSPEDVGLQDKIHRMELQLSRGDFDASPSRMESSLEVKSTHFNDTSSAISQSPNISNEALMTELAGEDFEEESVVAQSPADTMAQIESFKNNDLSGLDVSSLDESDSYREDSEESEMRRAKIDAILGFEEESGDSYKTENVSQVFAEEVQSSPEITTQTLGDLYYSQGQYEKSLKIFEKLQRTRPSVELSHKIQQCRSQLGVDSVSLKRQQKIDALNAILNKNRNNR